MEKQIDAALRDPGLLRNDLTRAEVAEPASDSLKEILKIFVLIGDHLVTALDEVIGWWREQRIRERAYAIWEQAGRADGKAMDHWLQAEAELRGNSAQKALPDAELIVQRFRSMAYRIQQ
jgi:hypothetical protein